MTQRRVRQIMDVWYGDGPLGYCGDEDYGEMASWYVLSAMGFYTVAPGHPQTTTSGPRSLNRQSTSAAVNLTVQALDVSPENKYINHRHIQGQTAWALVAF